MRLKSNAVWAAVFLLISATYTTHVLSADDTVTGDKGTDMVLDLAISRPLGIVATVVGSALFVVALPFTIPSGSVGESADALVKRPIDYTFNRPLGEFERCGKDRHPC